MKKLLLSSVTVMALASSMCADVIRVEAGAGMWQAKANGNARYGGSTDYDVTDMYGLDDTSSGGYFWAYLKHPLPVIPNVRIEQKNFSVEGKTKAGTIFDGNIYASGATSKLELDQTDFILYYNLLDNTAWITFDFGLNIKNFSGQMSLADTTNGETKSNISLSLPLAYMRGRVQIPATNIGIEADSSFISYDGSSVSDSQIKADWSFFTTPVIDIGAELGYRTQAVKFDSSSVDVKTDFTVSGMFGGFTAKF